MKEKDRIIKEIAEDGRKMNDTELLNWAMNQLFRAARTLEVAAVGAVITNDNPVILGCDGSARSIYGTKGQI